MRALRTSTGVGDRLGRFCHDLRQLVVSGLLLTSAPVGGDPEHEAVVRLATLHALFQEIGGLIDAEVAECAPRQVIDVPSVIEDCLRFARRDGAEIHASIVPGATAFGDAVLLRRAVTNLLDNAARAAGEHGTIDVRVEVADQQSVIEVTDDGLGFGRGPHGTGHGMAVVASAIEDCGGRLEILSVPAHGTKVRMILPGDREAS